MYTLSLVEEVSAVVEVAAVAVVEAVFVGVEVESVVVVVVWVEELLESCQDLV
jgi:hypothetical protein